MATFTTTPKSADPVYTQPSESSASVWDGFEKAGNGYFYDEINLFYDAVTDPESGSAVYYDGTGSTTTWLTQNES